MSDGFVTGIVGAFVVGVGATAVMDLWAIFQKRLFRVPSLDYAMVGRWIGHMPQGRFIHDAIGKVPPVSNEKTLGWAVHYAIGIIWAGVLIAVWGVDWLVRPTAAPALIIGIGSIIAPFFVMQPGLGAGVLASRTPKPWIARFRSLVAHTSFAIGLYLMGVIVSILI